MYTVLQTVKTLTKKFRPQLFCIKSAAGKKIIDKKRSQRDGQNIVKNSNQILKGKKKNKKTNVNPLR